MERSLSDMAAEALTRALTVPSLNDRALLMHEALSLHRRAVEERDALLTEQQVQAPGH
jgi:hypothetical protein